MGDDEGWHPDRREDVADVEFHRGAECGQSSTGAEAAPHMPDEPVTEVLVLRDLGRPLAGEFLKVAALSPSASHRGQPFAPLLLRWRPRIVGVADPFDRWIEEDDTGAAVGIGGSEKHADSRAISPGPKDSRLGVDGVHHRSNVVHHDLGRVDLTHTVRQTCAPLIEHDHSTESCKPLNMANEQRLIPRGQHIPGDTPNENEVRPTIAYHLIRDRHVTASGVVNLAPHDGSLAELKAGTSGHGLDGHGRSPTAPSATALDCASGLYARA